MDSFESGITTRQLQREFDLNQFTNVVSSLLSSLHLTTKLSITSIYQNIKQRNIKVIGKDVLQVLNIIQQQANNQKKIDDEIKIYRNKIQEIKKKGRSNLSIGQFYIHFVLGNSKKGIVTHQIQMKLSAKKSIAVESLSDLITSIESARKQIPFSKYKNHKQATKQGEQGETLDSLHVSTNAEAIEMLKKLIIANIYREQIIKSAEALCEQIQQAIQQGCETAKKLQQMEAMFTKNEESLYGQIFKLERVIQYKDIAIAKLSLYNQKLQKDIKNIQNKSEKEFAQIEQENQQLKRKNENLKQKTQYLQMQLQELKNEHQRGIEVSFRKIQQIQNSISQKQLKSMEQVIRNNLQTQLEEAYQNINKLCAQNQQLLVRISDLEIELDATSINANLAGSLQIATKPFLLSQTLSGSFKNDQTKENYLNSFRKNSSNDEDNIVFSISEQKSKSMRIIRSLTKQHFQDQNDCEDNQTNCIKPNEMYQLIQFDYFGTLQSKYLKMLTNFAEGLPHDYYQPSSLFSCSAQLMNSSSSANAIKGMIFSSNRISLVTSQTQIQITIHLDQMKSIYFCLADRNLIVINLKQQNGKQNFYILSVRRREQFVEYLTKYVISSASRLSVLFEKQQNIAITHKNKSMTIQQYLGLHKNIVSLFGGHQFQIKLKQTTFLGFLGLSTLFLLVVCQLGFILFENDAKNPMHKSLHEKKIKKFLPFSSTMEIIELSLENKLKIIYPQLYESYTFQLISYAETKLLYKKIMKQVQYFKEHSHKEMKKYCGIVKQLCKMRSQLNENLITTESHQ